MPNYRRKRGIICRSQRFPVVPANCVAVLPRCFPGSKGQTGHGGIANLGKRTVEFLHLKIAKSEYVDVGSGDIRIWRARATVGSQNLHRAVPRWRRSQISYPKAHTWPRWKAYPGRGAHPRPQGDGRRCAWCRSSAKMRADERKGLTVASELAQVFLTEHAESQAHGPSTADPLPRHSGTNCGPSAWAP